MLRKGLVVYEPKGRAGEYCPLAINLYRGCGHGCIYCWGPKVLYMDREEFRKAAPRQDIIKKLGRDIPLATVDGAQGTVLLSFTSDCYQPIDETHQLARQAITILHDNSFNVTILTKGGHRAEIDFDLMGPDDTHAASLTLLDDDESLKWEPGAALPGDRIRTLEKAHNLGMQTWVSLEPVIDPEAVYEIIAMTYHFVDLYKCGPLNYHPHSRTIDWTAFAVKVVNTFEKYGCAYYLKEDLRKWLPERQLCRSA